MIIAGSGSTALAAVLPTCSDQQSLLREQITWKLAQGA